MTAMQADCATTIAASVRSGRTSASSVVQAAPARIGRSEPVLNCLTTLFGNSALAEAEAIDAASVRGIDPGPLAGVPIAVKNLFDVAGRVTVAGSKIRRDPPAASGDATVLDRATRPRLPAGALLPATVLDRVAQLRVWFRDQLRQVFCLHDVLIAPATPCVAPLLGQTMLRLRDREVPLRPNLGLCTRPISFIGLPVVTVPVVLDGPLPIGVQIIAAPWCEALALATAASLERAGIVEALVPGHRVQTSSGGPPTRAGTSR